MLIGEHIRRYQFIYFWRISADNICIGIVSQALMISFYILYDASTVFYHKTPFEKTSEKSDPHTLFNHFIFLGGSSCKPVIESHFGFRLSILTVLPLRSCPLSLIPLPTPPQSRNPLPRVIETLPPSPTSTEGPDATDSDCTASSSSSSFSFSSSSSSFYATSSSSSTSDKVSWLDTLNRVGGSCLSGNSLLSSFFLLLFVRPSEPVHWTCPASCYSSPHVVSVNTFCLFLFSLIPVIPSQNWDAFEDLFKKKTSNHSISCWWLDVKSLK